ncbi:MAG TPA: recombinase family protein [Ktedonobacteraceae bacterium]|nr:recombinase family protein [Ktedonobacteraceae bacterium]
MNQPLIIDIYCRVSTEDQEDNSSLDEQESSGRKYCAEHSLIVGMVHREVYSGYQYRERKKLSLLRERYREGKVQGVVIRTLDRLSRSQVHNAILMEEMEHYEVALYCVKEDIDDTPMGKFIRMVLAFVAEMEREKIMDRTNSGRISRAMEGKVPVAKVPYGRKWILDSDGGHESIELVEEEAAVLRKAAQEYAAGVSLNSIVAKLNEQGVPAAMGGIWHNGSLLRLLTDPRITGRNLQAFASRWSTAKNRLGAVDLPDDTYPQIISPELYERVIARTEYNTLSSPRKSAEPEMFLLRGGLARCKYCGNAMGTYISRRPDTNRKNEYFYRCNTRGAECFHHALSAIALDKEVWSLASLAADHQQLIERSIALASKHDMLAADLASVERTITVCKGTIENYEADLGDPGLRGNTRAGIRQLLNTQYELLETLEGERAKATVHSVDMERQKAVYERLLEWCRKTKEERENLSYTGKRDFLELLGMTVFVGRRKDRYHELDWDAKLRLPELEAVLRDSSFSVSLSHEQA